jgi:tetratricopeptide (TPR) repeat protein
MSTAWVKAKWWFWRGRSKVRRKDFGSALSCFKQALNLYPESVYALSYTGFCLGALGQYERAIEFNDRVLQIQSDSAYAHAQLGRMFMYVGRPKEATESLTRAFRIQPKHRTDLSYQLAFARANADLGKVDEALAAYKEAAELDPENVEAQAGIGWALLESGDFPKAESQLRAAITLDPNYASPYGILGKLLRDLGRDDESISLWERHVALTPEDSYAQASLSWALSGVGRFRDALHSFHVALELKPDFPLDYSIGLCHLHLREYAESIEAAERFLSGQADADAYSLIASAKLGQTDYEGALCAARQATDMNPMLHEAWHNLGIAYFEMGEFQHAAASFQEVFELGRSIPDTHLLFGLASLKLGNVPAALEQCQLLHALDAQKEQELRDVASGSKRQMDV